MSPSAPDRVPPPRWRPAARGASYGGVIIERYLAWHPIDHIRWELAGPVPGGGGAEGARFRIVEAFGGVHYLSVMDVGARSSLFAPVNRVICRRFSGEMLRAWVKHNIEEVGQLEYLLPQLNPSGEAEPAQRA
jgi:hypothetical protein